MNMIYIDLKDDLSEKMVYDFPGRCITDFLKVTGNVNFFASSSTPCFCAHYLPMKKTSSFL